MSQWAPVSMSPPRPRAAFLWHPQLLYFRIVMDVVYGVLVIRDGVDRRTIERSTLYRCLRNVLARRLAEPGIEAFQFMVVAERGMTRIADLGSSFCPRFTGFE